MSKIKLNIDMNTIANKDNVEFLQALIRTMRAPAGLIGTVLFSPTDRDDDVCHGCRRKLRKKEWRFVAKHKTHSTTWCMKCAGERDVWTY